MTHSFGHQHAWESAILAILALLITLLLALPGPVMAASAKPEAKEAHGNGEEQEEVKALDPHVVALPVLILPVMTKRRLSHYFYVGLELKVVELGEVDDVRDKIPLIQDAFVREIHNPDALWTYTPTDEFDNEKLLARLRPHVKRLVGEEIVETITVTGVEQGVN